MYADEEDTDDPAAAAAWLEAVSLGEVSCLVVMQQAALWFTASYLCPHVASGAAGCHADGHAVCLRWPQSAHCALIASCHV